MSHKSQLRKQRDNTVINSTSKKEDSQCKRVVFSVIEALKKEFGIKIEWQKKILLVDIISALRERFKEVEFGAPKSTSFMSPDGGIVFIVDKNGKKYPILISEVKNQGTNDIRALEGKKKQAQGNAVERLGKNVIGFRTYMLAEGIFPFVCFGDGCDFIPGSSILDRVITIAMFGSLNKECTVNTGINGVFNRGSYFFRGESWKENEMYDRLLEVARKSVFYYFSKYGDECFITAESSKFKKISASVLNRKEIVNLPWSTLRLACGQLENEQLVEIMDDKIPCDMNGVNPACDIVATAVGSSMDPRVKDGDKVVIRLLEKAMAEGVPCPIKAEGIVVISNGPADMSGSANFALKILKGKHTLKSLNPDFPDIELEDGNGARIIGTFMGVIT